MLTKFRGLTHREALIFKGTKRWAEFSPFIEYSDQEASNWLAAALSFANQDLPRLHRTSIGVNATLPAVSPEEVDGVLSKFGEFSTVKIKVAERGQPLLDDVLRVLKVAESYPNCKIRLDANGNFTPEQALGFLQSLHRACGQVAHSGLLIGVDLLKDPAELEAAYDDALGVTAAFDLNLLLHINRLVGSDFAVRDWRHLSRFNAAQSRVEMHLQARHAVTVQWPGGERQFAEGETIHTENACKWTVPESRGTKYWP